MGCPDVADPPRPSAGRAYTYFAARSDALMSYKAARSELPSHPERHEPPKRSLGSLCTRRRQSPRGLSVCLAEARAPLIGLNPTLRQDGRNAERNRTTVHDRTPSSHRTVKPAWSGHWAYRHAAITLSTHAACAPRACEKRRLSPNLCSRLIFKCTQGDIAFPGRGSHLL